MMKEKRLEICLLVLFFAICLHVSGMKTMACECPTVIANVTYPEGWFLAYASDNPETIAPDTNETLNIFGCRPPFTWSVSGNGFDLSEDETTGLFNTLIADDTACGAAEITVTDNYGESVTGYVRCSNGQWVTCERHWGSICYWGVTGYVFYEGAYKYYIKCCGHHGSACAECCCPDGYCIEKCAADLENCNYIWRKQLWKWGCP